MCKRRKRWKMASLSTNSPCAACKFLRRKCQAECVFAPYFPPDQPHKFANVHKVFGASNVTKLLNELHPHQREDAVNSLAYEADMRLRDPVYGCVGVISLLQNQLRQLQMDLTFAKSELSKYQNLQGLTASHGLIAAAAAAAATATAATHTHSNNNNNNNNHDHHLHLQSSSLNNLGMGINLNSGGGGRDQFFPRDRDHHSYHQQQMMIRSFDGGNNYDASLLAMNAAAGGIYGQLSQQSQQTRAAAGDDRRTIDPS